VELTERRYTDIIVVGFCYVSENLIVFVFDPHKAIYFPFLYIVLTRLANSERFSNFPSIVKVQVSCERGNEPSGSLKCWEVPEWLQNWQLLRKSSAL
jgi:hypothetical protein